MTPSEAAAFGLSLVEQAGLPTTAPIVVLAGEIRDGTATTASIQTAWADYDTIAMERPDLAQVVYFCLGGKEALVAAAAATAADSLDAALECITIKADEINLKARDELRAVLDTLAKTATERAGKAATRNVKTASAKARLESMPAARALKVVAASPFFAAVEPAIEKIIDQACEDARSQLDGILERGQAAATAEIEKRLGVTFDATSTGYWWQPRIDAVDYLCDQFREWLLGQVTAQVEGPGEQVQEGRVAPQPVIETLEIAGGAQWDGLKITRTLGGDPIGVDGTKGASELALGPIALKLIQEAFVAWAPAPVAAAAKKKPGARISISLRSQLEEAGKIAADTGNVPLYTTWEWMLGDPPSGVHWPPHEALEGAVFENDADFYEKANADPAEWPYTSVSRIGDHPGCTCWKNTTVRIDQVEHQRRLDLIAA